MSGPAHPERAVFLSYASQDAAVVLRLAEALRAAGVEVWFDQNELVGGDAWDAKIRKQIGECALFVPVISAATQARREGYFRIEWRLAAQRTHAMADGTPFLVPVVIDATRDAEALVPAEFKAVQWTRLRPLGYGGQARSSDDEALEKFCARVKKLLGGEAAGSEVGARLVRAQEDGRGPAAPLQKPSRSWLVPAILGVAAVAALALWQPWQAKQPVPASASPSATTPTKPLTEAQQLVEKARKILDEGDEMNRDIYPLAEELLKNAEKLDVSEASAWALHSQLSNMMYGFGADTSTVRLEAMRSQAAKAAKLAPDSLDAQVAVVLARVNSRNDLTGFKPELDELAQRWPSEPRIARARMTVYRVLGDTEEAAKIARRTFELNPENVRVASDLVNAMLYSRHFAEGEKVLADVMQKRGAGRLWCFDVMLKLAWRGDRAGAAAAVARFPSWLRQEDRGAFVAWLSAFWDRNPERALAVVRGFPRPFVRDSYFAGPAAVLTALAHDQAGHTEAARADWRIVLQLSDAEIAAAPDNPTGYNWKAWASARLGDRAAAAEASAQIVQRNFAERSTFLNNFTLAPLWVALGQPDEAIHALGPSNPRSAGMTEARASLELSPFFDAIRNDPRFPGLVAAAAGPEKKPAVSSVAPDEKAVAVLPFANLSGDKEQEYFSDGLTEEILNALARERDLRVPGRASSFSFKGKNASGAEIAKALNVSRLVEGSVQRAGTKVRIRVSLTRVADNASEELGTFTEELADIFALQEKVARAVVEKLTHRQIASSVEVLTKNTDAYNAYLKGRALQVRSAAGAFESIKLYEHAVALDPKFGLAWARLAEARVIRFASGDDRSLELLSATRTAIDRALEVQPNLPEALIMRARLALYAERDLTAARRDLERAESLQVPTAELRAAQSDLAGAEGNLTEARRLDRESLLLDPQNGYSANASALWYFEIGEFAEADRRFALAMRIQGPEALNPFRNRISMRLVWRGPEAALRLLERAPPGQVGVDLLRAGLLAMLGRDHEAQAIVNASEANTTAFADSLIITTNSRGRSRVGIPEESVPADQLRRRAEAVRAETTKEIQRGNRAENIYAGLVRAEILLGHSDSALSALADWRRVEEMTRSERGRMHSFNRGASLIYARMGKADEAVALLRELQPHGVEIEMSLRHDPDFAPIRNDPRFQELMKQQEARAKAQPDPVDL